MKPKQLSLSNAFESSFNIRRDNFPKHHNSWHYHEQLELVFIYKGHGSLYLGDSIVDFTEGDCIFIGPNMPHFWLFHNIHHHTLDNSIDCIVIHFEKDFAGDQFLNLPELKELKKTIQIAEKGIILHQEATVNLGKLFSITLEANTVSRFISLMRILEDISTLEVKNIVSENYSKLTNSNDEQRMRNVMNYIRDNYLRKIELDVLANEAKMTKNSFCRYFKQKTAKSPTQFINELRVAHACRLLRNTKISLKEICFASGFNNFVSFHKVFKGQLNITPTQFRNN